MRPMEKVPGRSFISASAALPKKILGRIQISQNAWNSCVLRQNRQLTSDRHGQTISTSSNWNLDG